MGAMETINYYYYDLADSRIRDLFLMNSIWYPIAITLIYLVVVFKLAPEYMKNRPAYKLNTYIKCYNIFQIFANAYIFLNVSACYSFLRVLECRTAEYPEDSCGMMIVKCGHFGMLLKLYDLTETIVYILRKKNNQVSFLHLYHHISTYLLGAVFIRYLSAEVFTFTPILNCFVHVIMYFYYFLSNFESPIKQKIIPFKRYLTLIQMAQFTLVIVQLSAFMMQDCDIPKKFIATMLINIVFNYGLFYSFYKKTYIDKKKKI